MFSFAVSHVMLLKMSNCRCLGCHDAHVASALYIDTEYGSKLYIRIHVYSLLSFLWSFCYFFSVIILCFSVVTIFSVYWLKRRVLFVQLKML